ncbi:ectoine/hydroxyectoine ABC transporter ATP-binding protein EhuA [Tomitella biformata]|uniref:ectoine/hydroxyectoine ABC transporter ATP-binding protein EhuA n=1 Tax=Tomitella biformata TaxID=630403 RepID=UPI00046728A5|nr:ectoine/hydroxyectoine ABC transporter ATP-binding protein EhuA [Tomitella biformata]
MVRFEKVVKKFGDHTVLDHLDFTVKRGDRVTLIGPSGSGKTTILRLLMTLEKVTDGMIWVGDEPLSHVRKRGKWVPAPEKHLRRRRLSIGMVFQHFNLFPNMSVIDNITEAPIRVLGRSKSEARERALDLLEMVGLADKADQHPTTLSGGQQQRVAIARALAMEPEVLLLDEVTSALDPETVDDVLNVLREIARTTEITMLIVTHEMRFARDVSNRVLMFDGGRIVEEGTPEKIFTNPDHERTQRFLQAIVGK